MKRLWIAVSIIVLLAGLAGLHVLRLNHLTGQLVGQLEQASELLKEGDWEGANRLTRQVFEDWDRHAFYLHATLHHEDIDAIRGSMTEVLAFLDSREDKGECLAANTRLINQLELLLEAELPTIKNLL